MGIPYLQIENLTKSFGDRILFDDISFSVEKGDKIGLIAKNGTGKTTLLNLICQRDTPDTGVITFRSGIRVVCVDQSPTFYGNDTVIDACFDNDNTIASVIAGYEKAMACGDPEIIDKAIAQMDASDAWNYEEKLRQLLTRLHITDMSAKVSTLSGGQQKRIAIAKAVIQNPDLLILDEPTNHLDINVIEWLEKWLSTQDITLLMVTHDRFFLDRVCNQILELDNQSAYTYHGNYDHYLRKRNERIEAMSAETAKLKNTLRRELEWMQRQPQARAGKAKFRIDNFYKLQEASKRSFQEKKVELIDTKAYIGSKIFEAANIAKRFNDKVILNGFSYIFARHEKVGIVGPNGVGKSTFIKMLLGQIAPDSGHFDIGQTVKFGYYSQQGINFDQSKKVIDVVADIADDIVLDEKHRFSPMQFLTHFLFSPADQQKYIHTLSGGEKARLYLATILMRNPNFLVLDEPTNDLDIVTLGILEAYLERFSGCVIVISHDRYFLDNIVDHLFVMEGDGTIKDFPGNYSDYRIWANEQSKKQRNDDQQERIASSETPNSKQRATDRKPRMSYKQRQEYLQLSTDIDTLTKQKSNLEAKFASGEELNDVNGLTQQYQLIIAELDQKELRWLELSELE